MSSYAEMAASYVDKRLAVMENSKNAPKVRAILARLRRGIDKHPGENADIWEVTLSDIDEQLQSLDGEPTHAEWAIHLALCLFANHQQGKDINSDCMNKKGWCLGSAIRKLKSNDSEESDPIRRRFNVLATSGDIDEFAHHLRGMVQLLKANAIPLDYKQLTKDIYDFMIPERRNSLRLRWGQDFYGGSKQDNNEK